MNATITCSACGASFDDLDTALRHVDDEHPEPS